MTCLEGGVDVTGRDAAGADAAGVGAAEAEAVKVDVADVDVADVDVVGFDRKESIDNDDGAPEPDVEAFPVSSPTGF